MEARFEVRFQSAWPVAVDTMKEGRGYDQCQTVTNVLRLQCRNSVYQGVDQEEQTKENQIGNEVVSIMLPVRPDDIAAKPEQHEQQGQFYRKGRDLLVEEDSMMRVQRYSPSIVQGYPN